MIKTIEISEYMNCIFFSSSLSDCRDTNIFCNVAMKWRKNTQHNDIQLNDIQHNDIQLNDIQNYDIQHYEIQHNDTQL